MLFEIRKAIKSETQERIKSRRGNCFFMILGFKVKAKNLPQGKPKGGLATVITIGYGGGNEPQNEKINWGEI